MGLGDGIYGPCTRLGTRLRSNGQELGQALGLMGRDREQVSVAVGTSMFNLLPPSMASAFLLWLNLIAYKNIS